MDLEDWKWPLWRRDDEQNGGSEPNPGRGAYTPATPINSPSGLWTSPRVMLKTSSHVWERSEIARLAD
jgi:hypothetical protein